MTENPQVNPAAETSTPSSPTAMLAAQTQSLAELVAIQKAQSSQIEALRQQNERLLASQSAAGQAKGMQHVKIENVNMPFWALVGFMIKVSLASIPAMLILWVVFAVLALILGGVFGGFFGAFSDLLR